MSKSVVMLGVVVLAIQTHFTCVDFAETIREEITLDP